MQNGMKDKAARKKHAAMFTAEGLPKNANDWTEADFRDFFNCMNEITARVAARHGNLKPCWYCKEKHKPEDWCEQKREAWRRAK